MTSVAYPPTLSQAPGTPAHEWAQDTVGAVDGAAETTRKTADEQRNKEIATGPEPPGAFPDHDSSAATGPKDTATLSESVQSAVNTAQQSVSHTAGGVYATAEHAARQYLPASVTERLETAGVLTGSGSHNPDPPPSLPSQDSESNFAPTYGGVGALPGSRSETEVAKLPHERELEKDAGDASPGVTGKAGDVETREHPSLSNIPSTHTPAANPAPAALDLDHVTSPHTGTLHHPSGTLTSPDRDAQAAAKNVGKTTTAEGAGGKRGSVHEDSAATTREKAGSTASDAGARNKPLPSLDSTDTSTGASTAITTPSLGSKSGKGVTGGSVEDHDQAHAAASEDRSGERADDSHGKPSLAQKIKGEVKVLRGKMSKDAKKVEDGRAMKGGA